MTNPIYKHSDIGCRPAFQRGDIVRVEYASPRLLDEWLSGLRPIGPGDVGVVKYATGTTGSQFVCDVTVEFPMIGCYGVHSANLRLVQRGEEPCPTEPKWGT